MVSEETVEATEAAEEASIIEVVAVSMEREVATKEIEEVLIPTWVREPSATETTTKVAGLDTTMENQALKDRGTIDFNDSYK